ncbi:MAG: hypothetical protein U9N63_01780 [Pseudomonadota bacterium]|nr:hypothetical protein [Pseudomonadota bacterium]
MRKKQLLLIIATILCALIISSSMTFAASGQQVKIPYVVSDGSWWTGIAITNNSGDPITDMLLSFTTDEGKSGGFFQPPKPPPGPPVLEREALPLFIPYSTELAEIDGYAQLTNSLATLYGRNLPSDSGSVILSHTGSESFSVTVYIGSPTGFAFQVFNSTGP